jgi:hypothetical protein
MRTSGFGKHWLTAPAGLPPQEQATRDRGLPVYPAERHSERFWERWRDVIEFLDTAKLVTRVDLASTFAPFDAPSAVDETLRHARTHA